ncbi:MAG: secretin and TonB N-terminal domain-containing protein [Pseudogulbenkiania sp.]|nr:secretin and TonB N-terminal domain-containing protein [Pseudogulbenkiania sp.]
MLVTLSVLAGCASNKAFLEGKQMLADGKAEEGFARLEQAVKESPGNAEYKTYLFSQRERIINQWLAQAATAQLNGQYDQAEAGYRRILKLDPYNQRANAGLDGLAVARRHKAQLDEAQALLQQGSLEQAQTLLRQILAENPRNREAKILQRKLDEARPPGPLASPQLKSALARPITLEFRDAALKAVFEVISRTAGINFVFDKDVRPDLKATIFVRNTTIEDAIQLLLVTNQLGQRILNDNTIMVYPNNPAKQKDYQELVIKNFYLANAEAKDTANLLRALLKTRDVFVDDKRNLVVIRDTPEAVRLAEKLIASQDLAEPEAILEVEVLEVNRARLENLGFEWPSQVGYGLLSGGADTTTNTVTNPTTGATTSVVTPGVGATVATGVIDLGKHNNLTSFIANPALLLNLRAQDTNANVLANPRIRVKNHEKAKIHIGDKVPVFTSTAVVNAGIAQSVSYLDVGVKLEVQPSIGLDDDVTIDVGLEVSSIVKQVDFGDSIAYQIGSRAADTVLRLRDGETQVLAGLIQDEDRSSVTKIPGLGDLPLVGRLFSSNNDNRSKTEIVLLITPRIVHNLILPDRKTSEFRAGTETSIGGLGAVGGGGAAPMAPPPAAPAAPAPAAPSAPTMVPVPGIVPYQPAPVAPPAAPAAPAK